MASTNKQGKQANKLLDVPQVGVQEAKGLFRPPTPRNSKATPQDAEDNARVRGMYAQWLLLQLQANTYPDEQAARMAFNRHMQQVLGNTFNEIFTSPKQHDHLDSCAVAMRQWWASEDKVLAPMRRWAIEYTLCHLQGKPLPQQPGVQAPLAGQLALA